MLRSQTRRGWNEKTRKKGRVTVQVKRYFVIFIFIIINAKKKQHYDDVALYSRLIKCIFFQDALVIVPQSRPACKCQIF